MTLGLSGVLATDSRAQESAPESTVLKLQTPTSDSDAGDKDNPSDPSAAHDHDHDHEHKELSDEQIQEILDSPEVRKISDDFRKMRDELAVAMADLRETHVRYSNEVDQSEEAKERYQSQRDTVRDLLNRMLQQANRAMTYGDRDAATFALTMVQNHKANCIYNSDTFEAAAKLLDADLTYKYLFEAGLRSAVVTGNFETARNIAKILENEELEDIDYGLTKTLDQLEEDYLAESKRWEADENANLPRVRFHTSNGDFVVELYLHDAPSAVSNFIKLVKEDFYEDAEFFQVIDNLVALCGHPTNRQAMPFLQDETDPATSRLGWRGTLMMANLPLENGKFVPNSSSTQFSILMMPLPAAASQQTIFGRVVEGMDVVSTFRRVDPNEEKSKKKIMIPPDRIMSAEILREPETLPEPVYVTQPGPQPFTSTGQTAPEG